MIILILNYLKLTRKLIHILAIILKNIVYNQKNIVYSQKNIVYNHKNIKMHTHNQVKYKLILNNNKNQVFHFNNLLHIKENHLMLMIKLINFIFPLLKI